MDCFISYHHSDSGIASCFKDQLIAAGVNAFLAEQSIEAGSLWQPIAREAATRADVLLLLDSPGSRKSAWVQQEAGMALASGSLVVPVSLDGQLDQLPGWLSGFQALSPTTSETEASFVNRVTDEVIKQSGPIWTALPATLQHPDSISAAVLRAILLDQFSGPAERVGAWSRQYDRYLRLTYGSTASIPSGVSQGASLTFTGIIAEHLSSFIQFAPSPLTQFAQSALKRAEGFVLSSQDNIEGGFGRRSSDYRTRGGRILTLDIRHTCWAIRTLMAADMDRLIHHIERGLSWLARRAKQRQDSDLWCWTTAPLYALLTDPRISDLRPWKQSRRLLASVQKDLEDSFDDGLSSWVKGEQSEDWVAIDNALYVLNCLKDCNSLSSKLISQCDAAVERLISRSWVSYDDGVSRGIPLFRSEQADVGSTSQLLAIVNRRRDEQHCSELQRFIGQRIRERRVLPETFSWHLSSLLTLRELEPNRN